LGCGNGILRLKPKSKDKAVAVKFFPQDVKWLLLLLLLGIFSGGQQLFYAFSLSQTNAANAEVLHSITPIFITLIGWMFLSQKFEQKYLLGMAISILGSFALVANDFSITIDKLQGDGLALVSAILWSGYLLVLEKLQKHFDVNVITTWNYLLSTLFLFPVLIFTGNDFFPSSWQVWLMLIIMAIITISNKICLTYSLKRLSSGLVATIILLHPVITALLAWGIFSEILNLLNCLAFLLILFGIYLATSSELQV
jgi:drug/metabolite transporter (DMT)-like permease